MMLWKAMRPLSRQPCLQQRPLVDADNAEDTIKIPLHAGCFIAPLTFQLFWHSFPIGDPNSEYKAPFANVYRGMAVIGTQVIVPGLVWTFLISIGCNVPFLRPAENVAFDCVPASLC